MTPWSGGLAVSEEWPFDAPRNLAVVTLWRILRDGRPILYVSHDVDDGGWQFLDGEKVDVTKDAMLVCLHTVAEHDPSVRELADLPLGWCATRSSPADKWRRVPSAPVS